MCYVKVKLSVKLLTGVLNVHVKNRSGLKICV